MLHSVTLETKCWEGDWQKMLEPTRLRRLADLNQYPNRQIVLMVNNVLDYPKVTAAAQTAVAAGLLDRYVVVKDHADEALAFFGIDPQSFGRGYVYSIAELVSIYKCETEFLAHYSGDALPERPMEWIGSGIDLLQRDPRVKVVNLLWNRKASEAKAESVEETEDYFLGCGFSDQNYLVRTADFRQPIYSESHPDGLRYPPYGGELFEKRVFCWLRNHGHLRATYKHGSYLHEEAEPSFSRWAWRMLRRFKQAAFS